MTTAEMVTYAYEQTTKPEQNFGALALPGDSEIAYSRICDLPQFRRMRRGYRGRIGVVPALVYEARRHCRDAAVAREAAAVDAVDEACGDASPQPVVSTTSRRTPDLLTPFVATNQRPSARR